MPNSVGSFTRGLLVLSRGCYGPMTGNRFDEVSGPPLPFAIALLRSRRERAPPDQDDEIVVAGPWETEKTPDTVELNEQQEQSAQSARSRECQRSPSWSARAVRARSRR